MILLFLLFLTIFSYEYFKILKFGSFISLVFGALIYYLLLYNVTFNNDWNVYEALFRGEVKSRDYLFIFISYMFYSNGLTFNDVYKLYVVLIGVGFFLFIKNFTLNAFFSIISIYLLIQLIPLSNQIRYYLAFALFLMSTYSLMIEKSKSKFVLYMLFSIMSHSGVVVLFTFIYFFYKISLKNYIKVVLIVSLINLIAYSLFANLLAPYIGNVSSYLGKSYVSSLAGGVFSGFIWLFYYIYIHYIYIMQEKDHELVIKNDIKYIYLYKLSVFTFVFYSVGLYLQIAIHRYVISGLLIWVVFIFYSMQFENNFNIRIKRLMVFMILIIVTYIYIYILPEYVIGSSMLENLKEILNSNKLITSFL